MMVLEPENWNEFSYLNDKVSSLEKAQIPSIVLAMFGYLLEMLSGPNSSISSRTGLGDSSSTG